MRRRSVTLATAALLAGIATAAALTGACGLGAPPAGALVGPNPAGAVLLAAGPRAAAPRMARVEIVKVSGLIDPINADLLTRSIRQAESDHALVLVIQLNSTGGTVPATRVAALTAAIRSATVPVAMWVGGSGRPRAYGAAYDLLTAADVSGSGPGSRVGHELVLPGQTPGPLVHATSSGDDAVDRHLLTVSDSTLVSFLGDLNGRTIKGTTIALAAPGAPGRGFRKDLQFAFSQLSVLPKLLHTAASPDVAFSMLIISLSLVVFELFTAGVGVAAGTGIVFGVLAAYGLGVLPIRPYAVALVVLGILGFAVDVQAGAPRFWSAVGVVAYVVGASQLYHGQSVSLWVIVTVGVLLVLFMVSGMPAMVRTRFSTPTIGRESMIGEMGVATTGVDPEGTVTVNGAPWRARTNRATPIAEGGSIRVVAIDGLLLEVEPEVGGAKDAHH